MDDLEFSACDACGQRSYVWALLKSGLEVSYCGHHGTAFWDKLNEQSESVIDLRHMIGFA